MRKSLTLLIAALILAASPAIVLASPDNPRADPDWSLKADVDMYALDKNYCAGEPIAMTLHIANTSNEKLALDFGDDGVGAFTFEICDQHGKTVVPAAPARDVQSGGFTTRTGRVELPPMGATDYRLILNRWCSTILPEGSYEVICRFQLNGASRPGHLEQSYSTAAPVELRTPIVIVEPNANRLKGILERLWIKASRDKSSKEQEFARDMLCYCQTPLSARYKMVIALTIPFDPDVLASTEGLAAIGDVQAARYLVALCEDETLLPTSPESSQDHLLHHAALEALYKIRESGKPEILEVTAATAKKFQRPPKYSTLD